MTRSAVRGDPRAAARTASLRYTSAADPGIRRRRAGRGFIYLDVDGRRVTDRAVLARIRTLAVPPAWRDVWICRDPEGHLQAIGRDARGRKQYRYHPRWRSIRDAAKYDRLVDFTRALPRLRRQVRRDLACDCLCREKVVALVVSLLERAQLRIGNDEYTRANDSYGATTLRDEHALVRGAELVLCYRAKGGTLRRIRLRDRRLAAMVRRCRELPGQRLFQYVDRSGRIAPVTSSDVNRYLRAATGGPFTAKDFRTWAATLACALRLAARPSTGAQRALRREVNCAIEAVAAQLGNTPAVCRRSYIHPAVIDGFLDGRLARAMSGGARRLGRALERADETCLDPAMLGRVETAVVDFLREPGRVAA